MSDNEHQHIFGRGANGRCRICGAESQAGKRRRLKRERRQAPARAAWDLYAALKAKGDQ